MNILFVWTGVTSYMADCWRALASLPDVSLKIVIEEKNEPGTAFKAEEVLKGLDYRMVLEGAGLDLSLPEGWRPDVMFIVGWHAKTCRAFATADEWKNVSKVCVFDMPWQWKVRKFVARFVLWRYLQHFRAAFVPGRAAACYARWRGFRKVQTGLFGIDTQKFAAVERTNLQPYFLYMGRNSPEKRLDDLRAAYAHYAQKVENPWPLRMIGKGLEGGFVQPHEIPALVARAGALVLASDFDPWPLVIAESCAAGTPVICTESCTNRFELLRENGDVVKTGDVAALAAALERMHRKPPETRLAEGLAGRSLVAPYDCHAWAKRVVEMARRLIV